VHLAGHGWEEEFIMHAALTHSALSLHFSPLAGSQAQGNFTMKDFPGNLIEKGGGLFPCHSADLT
jgi:hypothetical protein